MTKLWGPRECAAPFACPHRPSDVPARVPNLGDMTKTRISGILSSVEGRGPRFQTFPDRKQRGSHECAALFVAPAPPRSGPRLEKDPIDRPSHPGNPPEIPPDRRTGSRETPCNPSGSRQNGAKGIPWISIRKVRHTVRPRICFWKHHDDNRSPHGITKTLDCCVVVVRYRVGCLLAELPIHDFWHDPACSVTLDGRTWIGCRLGVDATNQCPSLRLADLPWTLFP